MKKLLILLLIVCGLQASGQSLSMLQADSTYRDFYPPVKSEYMRVVTITQVDSAHADTTVSYTTGNVLLDKGALTIDNAIYGINTHEDVKNDSNDQYWQILDLAGGIACTLHWKSNYEQMHIDLQPDGSHLTRYFIK